MNSLIDAALIAAGWSLAAAFAIAWWSNLKGRR